MVHLYSIKTIKKELFVLKEISGQRETFKFAAEYRRFEWLKGYIGLNSIDEITVLPLSLEVINRYPRNDEYVYKRHERPGNSDYCVYRKAQEIILLINKDGESLARVGAKPWPFENCFLGNLKVEENISDTLLRIGLDRSAQVAYIISIFPTSKSKENYPRLYSTVIVYKAPDGFKTVMEWIEKLISEYPK